MVPKKHFSTKGNNIDNLKHWDNDEADNPHDNSSGRWNSYHMHEIKKQVQERQRLSSGSGIYQNRNKLEKGNFVYKGQQRLAIERGRNEKRNDTDTCFHCAG